MNENHFHNFDLIEPIQRALRDEGFETPMPIQQQAIPALLAGSDLLGCAQTGSGKTAAYTLPILQHLQKNQKNPIPRSTRSLVLAPTRELAIQIADSFSTFGRHLHLRQALVYGGVSRRTQISELSRGVDILVATPGRLLDLMGESKIFLQRVEIMVLDEADRMLDMGFIPDIRRIIASLPVQRQTLFFSATMPPSIVGLSKTMLRHPKHIEIAANSRTTPRIDQKVLFVNREDKKALLLRLLAEQNISRALVFTRTKHKATSLAKQLHHHRVRSDALHGDKTQAARQRALESFHAGRIRVLVATDVASRGIDVTDIDHVINFEMPSEPDSYIHRIGRTARAGKSGTALNFCDASEVAYLRQIERVLKKQMPVWKYQPFHSRAAARPNDRFSTTGAVKGKKKSIPGRSGVRRSYSARNNSAVKSGYGKRPVTKAS
jgi:ATP-dependent RNA helicase RhlE